MRVDKAIKVITGYCDKHDSCFETDDTADRNITSKCEFYNEKWSDCILKQCPSDWNRSIAEMESE